MVLACLLPHWTAKEEEDDDDDDDFTWLCTSPRHCSSSSVAVGAWTNELGNYEEYSRKIPTYVQRGERLSAANVSRWSAYRARKRDELLSSIYLFICLFEPNPSDMQGLTVGFVLAMYLTRQEQSSGRVRTYVRTYVRANKRNERTKGVFGPPFLPVS